MAKKKEKRLNEFRKERTKEAKGHPRYIFKKSNGKLFGLGITHGEHTNGAKNIPLKKNPDPTPKDGRPSYVRAEIESLTEKQVPKRLTEWKFGAEDQILVNNLIGLLEKQEKDSQKKKKRGKKKRK